MLPINNIPHEIWHSAFLYVHWKSNLKTTMQVCSIWNKIALPIVKRAFLVEKKYKLHEQMLPFLKVAQNLRMFPELKTWESIEHYCPVFRNLKTAYNANSDTMKIFIEKYEKGLQMEKHFISPSDLFNFSHNARLENTQNLIARQHSKNKLIDYLIKSRFIKFHTLKRTTDFCEHKGDYVSIFPIEMFELKVSGRELEEKPGVYCFPFKGKLIKAFVSESIDQLKVGPIQLNPIIFAMYMPQMHALDKDYLDYIASLSSKGEIFL
jgi:hypothetical protein